MNIRHTDIQKKTISLDSNGKPIVERNMDSSTVLAFLLYGAAIIFIIHFMTSNRAPAPIIIQQEAPSVIHSDSPWWSWPTTSYNYWPYWAGYWSGGSNGGYVHRPRHDGRPRFGGGPQGQLGGRYGPIGTPASRPGGRGGGGRR
jgi:hypothetical protein